MKTSDEVPNTSGLSNVASGQVLADTIAPGAVTSLAVTKTKSSALRLAWIASGDDGAERTATSYDVRYRTGGPVTEANWASCTQVTGEPAAVQPGYHRNMWIYGLSASTTYYIGIKALDEVPNASAIATVSAATPAASNLTRPLLQPSDFEFLGAFKLPQFACGMSTAYAAIGPGGAPGQRQPAIPDRHPRLRRWRLRVQLPRLGRDVSTWPQSTIIREWGMAVYGNPSVKPERGLDRGPELRSGDGPALLLVRQHLLRLPGEHPVAGLRRAGRSRPGGLGSVDVAECQHPGDARRQPDDPGLVRRYLPGRPETGRGLWRPLVRLGLLFPGAGPGGGAPSRWLHDGSGYHPPVAVRA